MKRSVKKVLCTILVLILITVCCVSAFAEVQPRWKQLSTFSVNLQKQSGIFSNSYVLADASSWNNTNTISLTGTIQRWNGSSYVNTSNSWSASDKGGVAIEKNMNLSSGNYIAHCVATVYDANGNYVETVTQNSNEMII